MNLYPLLLLAASYSGAINIESPHGTAAARPIAVGVAANIAEGPEASLLGPLGSPTQLAAPSLPDAVAPLDPLQAFLNTPTESPAPTTRPIQFTAAITAIDTMRSPWETTRNVIRKPGVTGEAALAAMGKIFDHGSPDPTVFVGNDISAGEMPPTRKQILVRFKKTATPEKIEAYLKSKGLRLVKPIKIEDHGWSVSIFTPPEYDDDSDVSRVTLIGKGTAADVARRINGKGIVLSAIPAGSSIPQTRQITVVFKQSAHRKGIATLLRRHGLQVLSVDHNFYTVGALRIDVAAKARRLQAAPAVLFASPVKFNPPVSSQLIITLKEAASEEAFNLLLRSHRLAVLQDFGGGSYKVARLANAPAKDLLATLNAEPVVQETLLVGGLTNKHIRSKAREVAGTKGGAFSSVDYEASLYMAIWRLEKQGATPKQIKLFKKLCDNTPVIGGRFNPWSGD